MPWNKSDYFFKSRNDDLLVERFYRLRKRPHLAKK